MARKSRSISSVISIHKARTDFLFRGMIIVLCICYNGSNKESHSVRISHRFQYNHIVVLLRSCCELAVLLMIAQHFCFLYPPPAAVATLHSLPHSGKLSEHINFFYFMGTSSFL